MLCLLVLVSFYSCEEERSAIPEEETIISAELNLEKGYETNQLSGDPINLLINSSGDTVPTGVEFKVIPTKVDSDTLPKPEIVTARNGNSNTKEFRLFYYPENIDTVSVITDSVQIIPLGHGDQDYVQITSTGDTIQTGIPVKVQPDIVKAKAPEVYRAMPPYYMDNCYSDIQSLDVAQGLKSGYINTFVQDKNKNLWFGTAWEGLGKYDGLNFYFYSKEHGLPDDNISDLVVDEQGNLWMYTDEGLCKFDGDRFYRYTEDQSFFSNRGTLVARDSSGNIWAANRNSGLAKFDGEFFTYYTPKEGLLSPVITDMSVGPDGTLWFSGQGVCNFDGKNFKYYGASSGLSADRTTNIHCARDGKVWATVGSGLIECLKGDKIVKYGVLDGLDVYSEDKALFEDSQGNLWIGTSIGACVYDGQTIRRFTTLEGQVWKDITTIMEDDAGNVWLGTYGSGMHRYKEKSFSMLTEYHGLVEDVQFAVHEDHQGNMWFGSRENGISKFDGNQFTYYDREDGLTGNNVRWITEDSKGNLWIGTNGTGVSKFDGKRFTNYDETSGLSHPTVKCVLEDSKGDIWFSTFGGLTRYDGEDFYHYNSEVGFTAPLIWNMVEDKSGNLWIVTDKSGLIKFDGERFISYTEREGMSTNRLRSVVLDDFGNVWIGTNDKGVIKFNGEEFKFLSEEQGLSNNVVMSILKDNDNNIWAGTDHGLSLIENNSADQQEHRIRNFSYVDGLKAIDFNTTSAFADSKGILWMPNGKGISTINSNYVNFLYEDPQIQLNHITVEDEYLDFRDDRTKVNYKISYDKVEPFYNYPVNPTFHYSIKNISFHYSAIDWSAPHRIQYSYKLEGLNDDWSNATSDTRVDFRNLSSGDYVFYVRAKSEQGDWGEPLTYRFTISTPWWKSTFAYGLYVVACIMFFVIILQWRTRRLKANQTLLEEKIALATEQLRDQNVQLGEQKEEIEHSHTQIKDSIRYSKKIQNSLLLSPEVIRENYSNFFLLFEPKDIVSGDFYFFRQFGDIDYISCVDCTGHGVPGGFMSTLSYLLMDKVIQDDSKSPGDILKELSDALIQTLHQENPDSIQDGMDMSICKVDRKNRTVEFSGARNGMLLIQDGNVKHIKPDILPVGGNYMKKGEPIPRKFETKTIKVPENAWIILYTDGYVEQLGGEDGLPMRTQDYFDVIVDAIALDDKEQILAHLTKSLNDWQGDQIRIDDVCLIGFKI